MKNSMFSYKKVLRNISALLLSGIMLFCMNPISLSAAALTERADISSISKVKIVKPDEVMKAPSVYPGIGTTSVKAGILIHNVRVPLFVTFDQQERALGKIADNPVISAIKAAYNLPELSNDNWAEYYDKMFALLDSDKCPSWLSEADSNFKALEQFFDIYENQEANDQITALATQLNASNDPAIREELLASLPYHSIQTLNTALKINDDVRISPLTLYRGFNIEQGIAYASRHATQYNHASYKVFGNDCTNFASQILENGGVKQVKFNTENKGWWHSKYNDGLVTVHYHSISWINANKFANYMKVYFTTRSHSAFAANIKAGDFIGLDKKSDGDWNHIGFVTDKSYRNGVYDYKVAQHSTNYHDWATSAINTWDKKGEEGATYGRIRR